MPSTEHNKYVGNVNAISELLSDRYSDFYHNNKKNPLNGLVLSCSVSKLP